MRGTRWKLLLAAMSAVTVIGCASPGDSAVEEVGGADQAIVGGSTDTTDLAVVYLEWPTGGEKAKMCSATFISQDTLLTAAHCVLDNGSAKPWILLMEDVYHPKPNEIAIPPALVESVSVDDLYSATFPERGHDLAFVKLKQRVGSLPHPSGATPPRIVPMRLGFTPPNVGDQAQIVGYGRTDWNLPDSTGIRRTTALEDTSITLLKTAYLAGYNGPTTNLEAGNLEHGACLGDSGGPVIVGGKIVAVTSRVPTGTCGSDFASRIDLDLPYVCPFVPFGLLPSASAPSVGTNPYGVAVADFDGDGAADFAESNLGGSTVSVYRSNGDGTFQGPTTYAVGNGPKQVLATDVDGDQRLDLVVVGWGTSSVTVLRGVGGGAFVSAGTFPVGVSPYSVVADKFDANGTIDLVVTSRDSHVYMLPGNGDGTFGAPIGSAASPLSYSITSGDFNGDHHIDVVVGTDGGTNADLLFGNGDGTFQAPSPTVVASSIVTATRLFSPTTWILLSGSSINLPNPNGTFQNPVRVTQTSTGHSIAVDVDKDGLLDIVTADRAGHRVNVSRQWQTPDGVLGFYTTETYTTGHSPFRVAAGDVNRDGAEDLVVTSFDDGTVHVHLNSKACSPSSGAVVSGAGGSAGSGAQNAGGTSGAGSACAGVSCDDGDGCTDDWCDAGNCYNQDNGSCSSQDPCAGVSCDDGNGCTNDWCDGGNCYNQDNGSCSYDPCAGMSCDDGNGCTDDWCDGGSCHSQDNGSCSQDPCAGVSCDDGNGCTDDWCWGGGCYNQDNGSCSYDPCAGVSCDDGNGCTDDWCDGGSCYSQDNGSCSHDPCAGVSCDDGNGCTDDWCDGGNCYSQDNGSCSYDPCAGVSCDDGDGCTDDWCDGGGCYSQDNGSCG